jgi:hypothetical protein
MQHAIWLPGKSSAVPYIWIKRLARLLERQAGCKDPKAPLNRAGDSEWFPDTRPWCMTTTSTIDARQRNESRYQ